MDPYIGEIRIVSQNFAPKGWALCNGQLLSIQGNNALFALLGKTYGGDGKVNFALPDLRGKVALGVNLGNAQYLLGKSGGQAANQLTIAQMPAHTHQLNVSSAMGSKTTPVGNYFANSGSGDPEYSDTANTSMSTNVISSEGGGAPIPNMQPYLGLSFMIALVGIWPPKP